MLFHVRMEVNLPPDMDAARREQITTAEKAYAQQLQHDRTWRHLWRIAGEYANYSIFDVRDNQELHDILTGLPLFPYMHITVTPLCRHPSSIHADDR